MCDGACMEESTGRSLFRLPELSEMLSFSPYSEAGAKPVFATGRSVTFVSAAAFPMDLAAKFFERVAEKFGLQRLVHRLWGIAGSGEGFFKRQRLRVRGLAESDMAPQVR